MTFVEVLVLKHAQASSIAITFDVLATANRLRQSAGRAPPFAVGVTGSGARSVQGLMRAALPTGTGDGEPSLVIVPGLGLSDEASMAQGLARRGAVEGRERLLHAAAAGAEIATSCSGTFLVAEAGLLQGRRATTTWWLAPLFRQRYPGVKLDTDALIVRDGLITTAGAAMAHLDLMLALVARHAGRPLADLCAQYLLLDERRSQARYMALGHLAAGDERVARAERFARHRLEAGFTMDDLAEAACLSPRTFARRLQQTLGMSPVRFVQKLRVERAVELLETTRLPFGTIAQRVGYAEPSTLRRLIRREHGAEPRRFRGKRHAGDALSS
ncbi:MAG: helix-turn-helix domain-containing protein [Ramlibacter sp.]|nr:helix-turn-helix domain-containing protein [Ramlibacter sp.]